MDLRPPDGEIEATASVITNCYLPASSSPVNSNLSVKSTSPSAETMMVEASIQTNTASTVDLLLCDDELSNAPPAITDQLTTITEASLPLVDSDTVPVSDEESELSSNPPVAFIPSIGAWAKPLAFAPPATPPTPATPLGFDPQYLNSLLDSFWPTLSEGIGKNQKKRDQQTVAREFPLAPVRKIPVPELKDDGTLRFPWAARMNPATRNLYRAATPTFRLDGTPQVTIPSQVLSLGPENKREYVIGQFHRCSLPPGGLIHAVVNRLWGRSCRVGCRKLSESSYMFHIPHDSTREWVVQRGVWHVDDCLLFVSPWKPVNSLKVPEVSTIPVWVTLKNVPDCCYSRLGLSHVATGLGEPMQTHKPRLDPTSLGEAKLLVEVELDKPFPKQIALDDKQGNIFLVDVEYTWIPSTCGRCGHLGHKEKRCLLPAAQKNEEMLSANEVLHEDQRVGPDKEQAQVYVASEKEVVQVEDSEVNLVLASTGQILETTNVTEIEQLQSQKGAELKALSTPVSLSAHSKETIATGSNSQFTISPLAGTPLALAEPTIMEEIPSHIIVSETNLESGDNSLAFMYTPTHDSPSHNKIEQFNVHDVGDGLMSDATVNLNMSRGGRPIKPTQKYEDLDWTTVRGKAKFVGIKSPIPYFWKNYAGKKRLQYGMNFAFGGTGVFNTQVPLPNMTTQIDFFKNILNVGDIYTPSNLISSVALVSVAGNDYSTFISQNRPASDFPAFIKQVVDQTEVNLRRIHALGVKKVAVPLLQPLGCLPGITFASSFQRCNETQNALVRLHNSLLQQAVVKLNNEIKQSTFIIIDLYNAFLNVFNNKGANPGSATFQSPLKPCCVGVSSEYFCGSVDEKGVKKYMICDDPKSAFFWDDSHPTEEGWRSVYSVLHESLTASFMKA